MAATQAEIDLIASDKTAPAFQDGNRQRERIDRIYRQIAQENRDREHDGLRESAGRDRKGPWRP